MFQLISLSDIERIREIDRSEDIHEVYEFKFGGLVLNSKTEIVKGFEPEEINEIVQRQIKLIKEGGQVIGAFNQDKVIGVASVEQKLRGAALAYCKMDILYVTKAYRGKGLARQLLEECKQLGKSFGARKLYISATPTRNTVDFYLNNGGRLVDELDEELCSLEPNDIHLEIVV
jgi:GNAT superfamily N-acetyltransferase